MELFILLVLLLAIIPAMIASNKGRSFAPWYFYGLAFFLIALIHSLLIKPDENTPGMKKCPQCSSIIPEASKICPACRSELPNTPQKENDGISQKISYTGPVDLQLIGYQDYLVKKYNISKNEILNKYIFSEQGFNTIDDALTAAYDVETLSNKPKMQFEHEVEKGKIGRGMVLDFSLRGNGKVVVSHPSGYYKEYDCMDEARSETEK